MIRTHLGTDQFANLIRNKVNFAYIPLGVDLGLVLAPLHRISLDRFKIDRFSEVTSLQALTAKEIAVTLHESLKERGVSNDFGIVILSDEGTLAAAVQMELTLLGYLNAFYVEGGMRACAPPKSANRGADE